MNLQLAPPSGASLVEAHEAAPAITVEDAALALLQLQLRVADLERENRSLRRSVADPFGAALSAPPETRPQSAHHRPL